MLVQISILILSQQSNPLTIMALSVAILILVFLLQIGPQIECKWQSKIVSEEFDILADEYYVDEDLEIRREAEKSNEAKENLKFYVALMATGASENPIQGELEVLNHGGHGPNNGEQVIKTSITTTTTTTPRIPLSPELRKRKETYEEGIHRLSCNNPWFWNTFECVWLDIRYQNIILRTKHNARVAAIFGGVMFALVALPICSFILMSFWIKSRIRKMEKRADDIVDKLRPGVFVHPDGTRHYYDPTPEELEAFEDLLLQFASVV